MLTCRMYEASTRVEKGNESYYWGDKNKPQTLTKHKVTNKIKA